MDDAEKFDWLRYAVDHYGKHHDHMSVELRIELHDLIDTMEERWELWNE